MRARASRVLAAVGIAVGCALAFGGAARADGPAPTLDAAGWWSRAQTGALPVGAPAPPTVGNDQLEVAGGPDGPSAVAALRFTLAPDTVAQALTLHATGNGNQGGSSAVLLACRAAGPWTAASNGQWADAPKADDTACISLHTSDGGTTFTGALTTLQSGAVIDVVVKPGVSAGLPAGANGSTFQLVFDAPTGESLAAATLAQPPSPPPPPAAPATTAAVPATSDTAASGAAPAPSRGAPARTVPTAPALTPTTAPPAATRSRVAAPAPRTVTASAATGDDRKWPGYLVLVAAASLTFLGWREQASAIVAGEQPVAAPVEAGLGRFVRPRTGRPPSLT